MLAQGRGKWAVSQIRITIQNEIVIPEVPCRRDEVETFNKGGYSLRRFYRPYDPP